MMTRRDRPKIALIIETSLASGREILRGIAEYVRQHRPWSIYHEPRGLEESAPQWLSGWDGDGIIARVQDASIAAAVKRTGLPVVDVLGFVAEVGLPLVHVDDDAIARLAAEHLRERGFKSFGFCGVVGANWSLRRERAFSQIIASEGSSCSVHHLPARLRGKRSWDLEAERLVRWLQSLPKPAGVMACNDPRGQQVLEACKRAAIAVPDEVSVIGVDNDEPVCEVSDPPLSSVRPDHRGVGYHAAELLDRMLQGELPPRTPLLLPPTGLIARRSTDVLAIEDRDVALAVRFVRDYACENIQVEDVIRESSLSRSVLKRRFRQIIGHPIHDEIVRVQLLRVQQLLVETDLSIGAIAERAGFRHHEYMGVVFKAKTGETPGAFRRRMKGRVE